MQQLVHPRIANTVFPPVSAGYTFQDQDAYTHYLLRSCCDDLR